MTTVATDSFAARNFAANVERIRTDRNMSKLDLAREAGITRQHIDKILKFTSSPTLEVMEKIARALQYPLGALLSKPEKTSRHTA